jgi:hypothetical protein
VGAGERQEEGTGMILLRKSAELRFWERQAEAFTAYLSAAVTNLPASSQLSMRDVEETSSEFADRMVIRRRKFIASQGGD